jgi:glutaminyl-peptide cyclotransferase
VQKLRAGCAGAALLGAMLSGCTGDASPIRDADMTTKPSAPVAPPDRSLAPVNDSSLAPTSGSQLTPAAATAFDSGRAWNDLQNQVAFGPRPSGSAALQKTRDYILSELKKAGIAARQQIFIAKTPLGEISMGNVIATIPGRRPERLAFASHFDTKLFRDIRFVGASDGASSTAALLELGRVLKARQNDYTIDLLFFDGEEAVVEWTASDSTYGSRYYVDTAQKDGSIRSLQALVLLDMIGDKELVIRRDSNSTPWLVDIIWNAAARLGHRSTFSNELTSIDDDHMAFVRAGVPSVDIIDLDYPAWHTAQDTLDNVSAKSLQIVGDVVLAALPDLEQQLPARTRR